MTSADLQEIRTRNRTALGLSGMAETVPGGIWSAVPVVGITTAFPPASASWSPGATVPDRQDGPGWGTLLLRHVIRPEVDVGSVKIAPYRDFSDWSVVANAVALGTFAVGLGGLAWALARAFGRGR